MRQTAMYHIPDDVKKILFGMMDIKAETEENIPVLLSPYVLYT
jgi:hypothetical protein